MHRVVDSESVIQFAANELHGTPLAVQKAEHVEYKSGRMLSSAGTTTINMEGPFERDETLETDSDSMDDALGNEGLSAVGTYSLKLDSSMKKSKSFIATMNLPKLMEGTLAAQFDEGKNSNVSLSIVQMHVLCLDTLDLQMKMIVMKWRDLGKAYHPSSKL